MSRVGVGVVVVPFTWLNEWCGCDAVMLVATFLCGAATFPPPPIDGAADVDEVTYLSDTEPAAAAAVWLVCSSPSFSLNFLPSLPSTPCSLLIR